MLLVVVAALGASPAGPLETDFSGWLQKDTEHFSFVYEPRDTESVDQLLSFADEVYRDVTGLLGSYPPHVWVVVAGRVDLANAYTTPAPPHITLYLAPPSEPLVALESSRYLRLLLAHELTHLVNFEYDKGMFSFLSRLFGPGVKDINAAFLPTWFLEGIATYTETSFTDGGRGRDPFFEMEYRALVRSGTFVPLSQAAYSSFFPPADRDWIGGYLFFQYLLDHWGTEVYSRIYDAYVRFPMLGPWKAIERVTGRKAEAIYADMIAELKERYGTTDVREGRRINPDKTGDWFLPVITARGWYLYRQTLEDPPAIVHYDPLTRTETAMLATPLTDSISLTATEDGEMVAFATYQETEGASGQIVASDLYDLQPRTGRIHRITTGARAWQPRYTGDGSRLLAVSASGPCSRLVEVDQGSGSMRLLFSERDAIVSAPTISPDGSLVAFTVQKGGAASVRVLPLSSPEAPLLAQGALLDFNVERATIVYGPSGQGAWYPRFVGDDRLLVSSTVRGRLALLSVSLSGAAPSVVCQDPVGAWSGVLVGQDVLYSTRRVSGCTLMLKQIEQSDADPRETGPAPASSGAPQSPTSADTAHDSPGAVSGGVPYHDAARFMAWAPIPLYYSPIAPLSFIAAPGAVFYGQSNLETTSFFGLASLRTDVLQPAVQLDLQTALGSIGASYSLSEGYGGFSPADYRQELVQQAGLSIPVVSSTELLTTTTLSLQISATDSLSVQSPRNFSFLEGLGGSAPAGSTLSHDLDFTVGVDFLSSSEGSPIDFFPRRQFLSSVSVTAYPPVVSASGPGELVFMTAAISVPSPIPHQAVKLGVKNSFVGIGGTFYQLTNPRGAFDPIVQSLPGRSLVALDYQIPVALLDAPLGYSLGLIGVGCALHVEAAGDWAISPTIFRPDSVVYAGAEVVLEVSAGEDYFPVGLGVAVRFDPRFRAPLDPATDIRPYLFISNDSLSGTVLGTERLEKVVLP